jgi:hypothetical protein
VLALRLTLPRRTSLDLESDGSLLRSQDTSELESGISNSEDAVLRFLEEWTAPNWFVGL